MFGYKQCKAGNQWFSLAPTQPKTNDNHKQGLVQLYHTDGKPEVVHFDWIKGLKAIKHFQHNCFILSQCSKKPLVSGPPLRPKVHWWQRMYGHLKNYFALKYAPLKQNINLTTREGLKGIVHPQNDHLYINYSPRPSIICHHLSCSGSRGGGGAYPSWHWVKAGVHLDYHKANT